MTLAFAVKENVARFFKLHECNTCFEQHSSAGKMSEAKFTEALKYLGLESQVTDPRLRFKEADINGDENLDLEDFKRIISVPSKLEQWLSTLPLARLLSFCLEAADQSLATAPDPLRVVSRLDLPVLSAVVDGFCDGAKRLLSERAPEAVDVLRRLGPQGAGAAGRIERQVSGLPRDERRHRGELPQGGDGPDR